MEESRGAVFGLGGVRTADLGGSSMKNLTSPTLIKAKGILFLFLGLLASALLLFEHPALKIAVLLAIAIWSFCRFYYFAFYVIQHYVDPSYQFPGLSRWSAI
jgi:hypothetical protein